MSLGKGMINMRETIIIFVLVLALVGCSSGGGGGRSENGESTVDLIINEQPPQSDPDEVVEPQPDIEVDEEPDEDDLPTPFIWGQSKWGEGNWE